MYLNLLSETWCCGSLQSTIYCWEPQQNLWGLDNKPHFNQLPPSPPLPPHESLLTLESKHVPYQYHVTSGDVHVGRHWLFAPGGGAAAGRRAARGAIAELGRDAVEPRVTQGLRPLDALWRPDCHTLTTQLLGIWGDNGEEPQQCSSFLTQSFMYLSSFHAHNNSFM